MKRILSVGIALVLCASMLCGCELGDKITAFGLYTRAMKTIRNAGGYEIDCVVSIDFDIALLDGLDLAMNMNLKQNGDNSQVSVIIGDETTVMTTTRIGDDIYVSTGILKQRFTANDSYTDSDKIDISAVPKITEEIFDTVEVIRNEDGTKSLVMEIDGSYVTSFLGEIAGDRLGEEADITFDDAELTMNFDSKGNLEGMVLACDAVYKILGFPISGTITADYTFINFGTAPEILPPEDADSYIFSGVYGEE